MYQSLTGLGRYVQGRTRFNMAPGEHALFDVTRHASIYLHMGSDFRRRQRIIYCPSKEAGESGTGSGDIVDGVLPPPEGDL